MKMKFSIAYAAKWGHALHVELTFAAADGYQETMDLPMTTRDGYHWEVEMASRQNRHHPFVAVAYCYCVKDAEGKVLRRESLASARQYVFDESKNFYFQDYWLEEDNPYVEKNAFVLQQVKFTDVKPARLPLFDRTIIFKIHAPKLYEGEAVALLGNHPTLGKWNPAHFLKMQNNHGKDWEISVNVQAIDEPIEYKYVVIDAQTQKLKRWEFGDNRIFGISGNEQAGGQGTPQGEIRVYHQDVYVLHGGEFRIKRVPVHAQFNFDTYIFDLDGTLISSLHDLAASCNYALKLNGMPERTLEEVRMFVGNGVKKLMERAVPGGLENEKFEKTLQDFRQHYMVHNMDNTKPYPDVMEMLEELKNRGKNIAVVSNKFYAATQEICRHFFGDLVDVAIGERENIKKKPAPDTVNEALRQLHADRERAVYIGDSDVDVMTAKNSGMPCISVLWGFRDHDFLLAHGASILVSSPLQIL